MINNYKIIVARYNEDLDWLKNEMDNCIIYNKGNKLDIKNEIILKNVGRESHTYLQYIIDNYNNLPDIMIFTQGNISDHYNHYNNIKYDLNELLQLKDSAYKDGKSLSYITHKQTENGDSCWDSKWNFGRDDRWFNGTYLDGKPIIYIDWFKNNINENYPDPINIYCYGILAVRKDFVLKRSFEYYQKLIKQIDYHSNPTEGHLFERSWYYIFD
jgi:hypothetical protein